MTGCPTLTIIKSVRWVPISVAVGSQLTMSHVSVKKTGFCYNQLPRFSLRSCHGSMLLEGCKRPEPSFWYAKPFFRRNLAHAKVLTRSLPAAVLENCLTKFLSLSKVSLWSYKLTVKLSCVRSRLNLQAKKPKPPKDMERSGKEDKLLKRQRQREEAQLYAWVGRGTQGRFGKGARCRRVAGSQSQKKAAKKKKQEEKKKKEGQDSREARYQRQLLSQTFQPPAGQVLSCIGDKLFQLKKKK